MASNLSDDKESLRKVVFRILWVSDLLIHHTTGLDVAAPGLCRRPHPRAGARSAGYSGPLYQSATSPSAS